MTRMTGPYRLIIRFVGKLFITHKWRQAFYFYHNDRSGGNPHSECYMVCLNYRLNAVLIISSVDVEYVDGFISSIPPESHV